jgi:acyl-CoA synthetase (AMP-forming)/AMP-acid ligase II
VFDCAVVGVPDEKWGEKVAAVVITRPGVDPASITEKDIMECCREKLAGYKRPKEVIFISQEDMPRTPTGKILHRILKERLRLQKK